MHRINTRTYRQTAAAGAIATATAPTPGPERRLRVQKVSATYSGAGAEGVLQIISDPTGTPVVLWELGVDSDGGIIEDFIGVGGLQLPKADVGVSAVLSASGAGVVGRVNLLVSTEQ